nr:diguanylate cyclase [Oscillospiraceae bacterium]
MSFLSDYFHTPAPAPGTAQPAYYRKAMGVCTQIMAAYFLLSFFLIVWRYFSCGPALWMLVPLGLSAAMLVLLFLISKINARYFLWIFSLLNLIWCNWYIYRFGWSGGVQLFLFPMLILTFFNIYETPLWKTLFFLLLLSCRMFLFSRSLQHPPFLPPDTLTSVLFQTVNCVTVFLLLAFCCILFSTNLQDTERQLRIDNQTLHREAETDPLTQLPNRRFMLDEMELFRQKSATDFYSVAIADIDFFKRVNDTYGHSCGDYTLRALADLFREKAPS